ncbi:hypothetical protein D3C76_1413670 [compost metagenome]
MRNEQASDPQVDLSPHCVRDQRISGFLDTVMNKLVGALLTLDQFLTDSLPKNLMNLLLRGRENG